MSKYIKELGIKDPNLLIIVKTEETQYAFPVPKESLAYHSTVFADMLSLSSKKEEEEEFKNGWIVPFDKLETVVLDDAREHVENALCYLLSECALPTKFDDEEAIGVYKVADKYGMQRLCDWMKDRLVPGLQTLNKTLLIGVCEASSNAGDVKLQQSVAVTMSQRTSEWYMVLKDGVYYIGEGSTKSDLHSMVSASCAALIMHTCLARRTSTVYNVYT